MDWPRALAGLLVVLAVLAGAWLVFTALDSPGAYETGTVRALAPDGSHLATVDVRIADTPEKHRVGLSKTDTLGPDEGMLFVFDDPGPRAFYMPESMAFPLDMVFARANGTITTIHHAPLPANVPEGTDARYRGPGRYVLEVPLGWANRTGVSVGDRLVGPAGLG